MDGKAGNQNVEMKQTQKHSGCSGENHCLIFGFAETKTGWPGFESCFTSKSSLQVHLHNQFQLWLTSVLNKQLSSLGIFRIPVGWQRKDMQHRGLKGNDLFNFCQPVRMHLPEGSNGQPPSFPVLTGVLGRKCCSCRGKMFHAQCFKHLFTKVLSNLGAYWSCLLETESTWNLEQVPAW